ncbi:MAG: C39 family peptidase [Polyangiaceae bacterium]|nr:C39 family peptidase [Polyangiaceae bacterium]
MGLLKGPERTLIPDDDTRLDEIEQLALAGHMLRAFRWLEELRQGNALGGVRARCTAAWIGDHLGASSEARREYALLNRVSREHPSVRFYYGYLLLRERGAASALRYLRGYTTAHLAEADASELESLRARLWAYVRDAASADEALALVNVEALGEPRWVSAKAALLEYRDERGAALELVQEALLKHPHHRLLVQAAVSLLEGLDQQQEALSLLRTTEPLLETPSLASQRAGLEHNLGLFDEEARSLDRFEQLSIVSDASFRRQLKARRAQNAYRRGDCGEVLRLAEDGVGPYWERLRRRLTATTGKPQRTQLDTPVVIQDHMGCAPTSLAIISAFFGDPVDHVDVGDQICYEGTAAHSERGWVEGRGWISREFTVDYQTAQALIGRGIPFLLVTVSIASAHAQVVVGVDATMQTLIIRDPNTSRLLEFDAETLFQRHRAYGPRGHVLLPRERAHAVDGLILPEVDLHDHAHQIRVALGQNDRALALEHLNALVAVGPQHQLALWGARSIAGFDGDPYAMKECSERLLEAFPDDVNAEVEILDHLGSIGTEAEQRTRLESCLARKDPPWIFFERLGALLSTDASQADRARRLLTRAHRMVPYRGCTLALLGNLHRNLGDVDGGIVESRLASTLEATDDRLASEYFDVVSRVGRSEEAFAWLRTRAQRFCARSNGPAQALFRAFEWADRVDEGFDVLRDGLLARPEDPDALAFAAEAHARYGRIDAAEELLGRVKTGTNSILLEQTAARIAELASRLPLALERHLAVLKAFPFSLYSHQCVAGLLLDLKGPSAAREHLAEACARYPTHRGLRELYCTWLRGHDPAHVLPELEALIQQQPLNVWAHRERAGVLSELGRNEDAIHEAELAVRLAPKQVASQGALRFVLLGAGKRAEALEAALAAFELEPDAIGVVGHVLRLANSLEHQRTLLELTDGTLASKSVDGTGILEWHEFASGLLPATALESRADHLVDVRPNLWVGFHLKCRYLLNRGEAESAREVVELGLQRFRYLPRLEIDLADACHALGDLEGEWRASERAVQLNPGWILAVLRLSQVQQRRRDIRGAVSVLERGLTQNPRSAQITRALAQIAWSEGRPEEAFSKIREAIAFDPEEPALWETYIDYAQTTSALPDVVAYARLLAGERPWNVGVLLQLAEVLRAQSENLASLEVLEAALERRPGLASALDAYVMTLVRIGRKKEALAACDRAVHGYYPHGMMRTRKAWILWEYGEKASACSELVSVLKDHPDQVWGHQLLVDWQLELEQAEPAIKTAEALVLLAPLQAMSHGYLASAFRAAEKPKQAWESLGRAAAIDPTYWYAADTRVTMALAEERVADAESVLAAQGPHLEPYERDLLELRCAIVRKDEPRTLQIFGRLAKHKTTPGWILARASSELARGNTMTSTLARGLYVLAQEAEIHAETGALWVEAAGALGKPSALAIARLGRTNPDTQGTAAYAYLGLADDKAFGTLRVLWAIGVLWRIARRNDLVWGRVGYLLVTRGLYVLAVWWLRDYRNRSSVEAWMLHNYRVAALNTHQPKVALTAVEDALKLPADVTLHRHLAFLAFAKAANRDIEGARALTSTLTPNQINTAEASMFELARLLVELPSAAASERPALLQQIAELSGTAWQCSLSPLEGGTTGRWAAKAVLASGWSLRFFLRRWGALWVTVVATIRFAYGHAHSDPTVFVGSYTAWVAAIYIFLRFVSS